MAEGRSAPLMSRTSRISELRLADIPLPKSGRILSGDIQDLDV